jgi:transposase-like protein
MDEQRKRRRFEPLTKAEILKRVLKDRNAVSDVCEEFSIGVTQFYGWQNEAFARLHRVFELNDIQGAESQEAAKLKELKEKLVRKDAVISEMMTEIARQKKRNGEV